jgi:hypothetical protein
MASGPPLKLTVDRQNRKLVAYQGTPTSLPDLFQSNTISLQIQVVDPSSSSTFPQVSSAQYTVVDGSAFGMRAAVGDAPEGISGPTPIALQDTMLWDATTQSFKGDLALNTTGVDDFLGTSASKPAYFELNLTITGTRITILQNTFNLKAVVDELGTNVPTPTAQYLTAAEIVSQFMPLKGAAGQTFILVSPDGATSYELGVDNFGNLGTKRLS